jgi:hypothetical protein
MYKDSRKENSNSMNRNWGEDPNLNYFILPLRAAKFLVLG